MESWNNKTISEKWDALLKIQTQITLEKDICFFESLEKFSQSKRVLDLGSGNGYYLSQLAKAFPKKTFVGVEKNSELFQVADQYNRPNLTFVNQDIYDIGKSDLRFDVILCRLVYQHLPDAEKFWEALHRVMNHDSVVIIIEADDTLRFFSPFPDSLKDFFKGLTKQQKKRGLGRNPKIRLPAAFASRGLVTKEFKLFYDSLSTGLAPFRELLKGVTSLGPAFFGIPNDEGLNFAVSTWGLRSRALAQIALSFVVIQKGLT